jgi:hypothetical protein
VLTLAAQLKQSICKHHVLITHFKHPKRTHPEGALDAVRSLIKVVICFQSEIETLARQPV